MLNFKVRISVRFKITVWFRVSIRVKDMVRVGKVIRVMTFFYLSILLTVTIHNNTLND